ncbi:MAG: DUF4013 domain-containing protein [Eggerthellaceae bacterium]|jgi:hypothetical protein
MQNGYYRAAWDDIKSSPHWISTIILLSLILLISVAGPIFVASYSLNWARDIAWGVREPMPKEIFISQPRYYLCGFFSVVIFVVLGLLPFVLHAGSDFFAGLAAIPTAPQASVLAFPAWQSALFTIAGVLALVCEIGAWVAFFFVFITAWVGTVRMRIYERLSAGFQFTRIWSMIRHDFQGIFIIFGMTLLLGVIGIFAINAIFLGCISGILGESFIVQDLNTFLVAVVQAIYDASYFGGWAAVVLAAIIFAEAVWFSFLAILCTRALGYWVQGFDVAQWRGSEDPMPFELAEAARAVAREKERADL